MAITPILLAAVAAAGADLPLLLAFCVGGLALLTLGLGVVLVLTSLLGLVFHIWSQIQAPSH